jgi:glycosyltransferase involved in cell wall biosynthesis
MRVLIDATFAERARLSGTGVYIDRLVEALAPFASVELVRAVNPRRREPAGGGLGSVRNLVHDLWWTAVELPRIARRERADLIHHPLPAYAAVAGVPQVITVVDLAFELLPECFARGYRTYAHLFHRAAARRAARVICISESTAGDVARLWGVPAGRLSVAHLGPGQELSIGQGAAPDSPRHFLYVGDGEPRKNLGVLLDAYTRYRSAVAEPLELVLAGSAGGNGARGVRVVKQPDGAALAELYGAAAALVHPALHEGFGLTPLEAMRLGVPVIAARSAGVLEVCGEAAVYADARDPAAFASAMVALAGSAGDRRRLSALGLARAAEFSWAMCARAHVDAYSLALGR